MPSTYYGDGNSQYGSYHNADVEDGLGSSNMRSMPVGSNSLVDFSMKSVRHGFIRKVMGILCIQLLITFGMVGIFVTNDSVKIYVRQNPWAMYLAMGLTFAMLCAMACVESIRKETPCNYITLFTFTLLEGYLIGAISSFYNSDTVFLAVGVTAIIVFALTLFACQTSIDFTLYGGVLFCFLIALLIFGFICAVFVPSGQVSLLNTVYSCLGALLFSFYLVYDIQLIMGGKHKYSIGVDEYVLAALSIYLDIINLFLFILSLLGDRH